ncbi:hypothetical protein AAG906_037514 [Vitis piasezkii]
MRSDPTQHSTRTKFFFSFHFNIFLFNLRALNSIFQQWGISASKKWNTSGEPCTGAAIDSSEINNPGIKCDCSYDNASTCHITQLKVCALDVVGVIPDELWNLTFLTILYLAQNYLTGPLSASIGNLRMMQNMELPKELGQLTNLRFLDKIKSCTHTQQLGYWTSQWKVLCNFASIHQHRLSAPLPDRLSLFLFLSRAFGTNNFSGSLPSELGNLVKLEQLWASDNELTGNIPDFIGNWSKLTVLIIRNNNISDAIPSNIGEYGSLTQLDLSFNNLSGQLPESLFNLSQLTYFNLVANNFTLDSSNSSVLPSGLNCLQQNFPCNRGSGIYYNFAIKCGGPQITSSDQIVFERDNETLGPATYYVTDENRWAVSNVGLFSGSNNPQYTSTSSSQFTNTLDSELFQTARISAGSLRYYGLGLENGNYTLTLQFAETAIVNSNSWKSLGRRVFDVYIQVRGRRVSFQAVKKEFTAQVLENYIEIHLFWAGKGTCCVPAQGTYGPAISAISATPDFEPTVSNAAPNGKKNRTGLIVGIAVGLGVVCFLSVFAVYYFVLRRKKAYENQDEELLGMDARPYTFSYAELKMPLETSLLLISLERRIWTFVAVKQLSVASHQGKKQFVAEIATISAVQHRNLVKLYGCCIEGVNRSLVYEYLENKSLDQALFGKGSLDLDWPTRYDICLGVARGLAYLHEESRVRIVHRDVKASNILLDYHRNPKISDFGLAKLYDDTKTHISTRVAGTIGYLAPEYAMRGHLTEKADVFGFGVVALEIVSGRPNSDTSLEEEKTYLLEWAWQLHENNREIELVDSRLSEFSEEEARRMIGVALLCTQTSPTLRPPMSRVVAMLSGDIEVSRVTTKPGYLTDWKFNDASSFMSENSHFNSSTSISMAADADRSPVTATKTKIHEIIGEGR